MNAMEPSRIRVKSDFLLNIERRIVEDKVDEKMKAWQLSQLILDAENEKLEMNKSMLFFQENAFHKILLLIFCLLKLF